MDDEKQGAPPPEGGGTSQIQNPTVEAESNGSPPVESPPAVQTALIKPPPPPPPPPPIVPEEEEEGGMLRMSFMEHLGELRARIIKALYGLPVAFAFSLVFAGKLWDVVSDPAVEALKHLGVNPPRLAQLTPMESFSIIWVKLPLLCSVFIASPCIVYQVWAFISPGLYKKERRLALPFVLLTAGLFIGGGCFPSFLAFRSGLEFLLGMGM